MAANLDILSQTAVLKAFADGFPLVYGDDDHERGKKTWFKASKT